MSNQSEKKISAPTSTNWSQQKIEQLWGETKVYKWDYTLNREDNFSIDSPPPTISGALHIGHFFSYTQCDINARYQRMKGKNVFYPMGYDNNGLPTERLTEKEFAIRSSEIPRHEFIDKCKEIVSKYEGEFRATITSMGLSVDWDLNYDTISEKSLAISQLSFLDLYEKGLVERRSAPSFWDPVDKTALAQAEIEDKEREGVMHDINFTLDDVDSQNLTISTTRPEMLPACVALLYNPEDNRYTHLSGMQAIVPLISRKVPIIPDHEVIPEKGSGLVMCCTFGDIQDITWWRRHNLPIYDTISRDGIMQDTGIFDGLNIKKAREDAINRLKTQGLWVKETKISQTVKCAERSGSPLEIVISDQWYIRVIQQREQLVELGRTIEWHPHYMRNRYESWINGLNQDWCISRQRHFGVTFPVWYSKRKGEEGKILLARPEQLPVDPMQELPFGYARDEVIAEVDVMDTWATSALTPEMISGYINEKYNIDNCPKVTQGKSSTIHNKIFPFDIRPQAHEIIRTWTFGTATKALYHQKTKPWNHVLLSGWCLAEDRKKMSKSKGNATVTLNDLIDTWGADALRYWSGSAALGNDTVYNESSFQIGKRFINKLRNATSFVAIHAHKADKTIIKPYSVDNISQEIKEEKISYGFDLWIIAKLNETIQKASIQLENFEYNLALNTIEEFFWKNFCDNYLELAKNRAYQSGDEKVENAINVQEKFLQQKKSLEKPISDKESNNKQIDNQETYNVKNNDSEQNYDHDNRGVILTMLYTINSLLRLLAPFFPYVTEELFQEIIRPLIPSSTISLHQRGNWPLTLNGEITQKLTLEKQLGDDCIAILQLIRKYKSLHKLSIKSPLHSIKIMFNQHNEEQIFAIKNSNQPETIDSNPHDDKKWNKNESNSQFIGFDRFISDLREAGAVNTTTFIPWNEYELKNGNAVVSECRNYAIIIDDGINS